MYVLIPTRTSPEVHIKRRVSNEYLRRNEGPCQLWNDDRYAVSCNFSCSCLVRGYYLGLDITVLLFNSTSSFWVSYCHGYIIFFWGRRNIKLSSQHSQFDVLRGYVFAYCCFSLIRRVVCCTQLLVFCSSVHHIFL